MKDKSLKIVNLLLKSYYQAYGEHLITTSKHFHSTHEAGTILFTMPYPVMAHDNTTDPCLSYANSAALQLWGRCWETMIGMPSRLTAPTTEYEQRKYALIQARENHAIKNYQGIRVNRKGELFIIKNVRIWTIWDEEGCIYGQAATFNLWEKFNKEKS